MAWSSAGLFRADDLIYVGKTDGHRLSIRDCLRRHLGCECTMTASHYTWELTSHSYALVRLRPRISDLAAAVLCRRLLDSVLAIKASSARSRDRARSSSDLMRKPLVTRRSSSSVSNGLKGGKRDSGTRPCRACRFRFSFR